MYRADPLAAATTTASTAASTAAAMPAQPQPTDSRLVVVVCPGCNTKPTWGGAREGWRGPYRKGAYNYTGGIGGTWRCKACNHKWTVKVDIDTSMKDVVQRIKASGASTSAVPAAAVAAAAAPEAAATALSAAGAVSVPHSQAASVPTSQAAQRPEEGAASKLLKRPRSAAAVGHRIECAASRPATTRACPHRRVSPRRCPPVVTVAAGKPSLLQQEHIRAGNAALVAPPYCVRSELCEVAEGDEIWAEFKQDQPPLWYKGIAGCAREQSLGIVFTADGIHTMARTRD